MRDFLRNIVVKRAISPVSVADTTAQVSQIIDRQGFESLAYLIATGSLADADATFTVLLEEGDASNLSDAATVAAADMISETPGTAPLTAAGFTFASDDNVRAVGYIGNKRYTRLTITPVSNASAALMSAVAVLTRAGMRPTVQPVA